MKIRWIAPKFTSFGTTFCFEAEKMRGNLPSILESHKVARVDLSKSLMKTLQEFKRRRRVQWLKQGKKLALHQ